MITKLKKCIVLFLVAIMSIAFSISSFAEPRVAVQINMSTDADNLEEVGPRDEITATVTWKSVLASSGERFTIQTTNGAEILIENEEDVTFQADGTSSSIKSVVRNSSGDTVTFTSGPPATSPSENKIIFKIKAPSKAGKFNMSVKIGAESTPNNPSTNFAEKEFTVNPLKVDTSLDVIKENESFEVFGTVVFDDTLMIAMEIRNKSTGEIAFDSTTTTVSSDGKYSMGSFSFNESHATGKYIVEVLLLDSSYNPVSTAKKEIELVKSIIPISMDYRDIASGQSLSSHIMEFEYGSSVTLSPKLVFTGYELVGVLVNGQQASDNQLQVTVTEPLEVVFQYEKLYGVSLKFIYDGMFGGGEMGSGGHRLGAVVHVTAPDKAGYKLVGVLVNDQRSTLINGNQVQVTITGNMEVSFEYEKL